MPKFRVTITYEYDAEPEFYFDEIPEELTPEHIQRMIEIDSGNMFSVVEMALESDYNSVIECVEE